MKRFSLAIVAAALLVLGAGTAAVAAEPESFHPDVQYALAAEPGGIATSYTTAVWPALGMSLTVSTNRAVGACPTGYICAYSGAAQAGTELRWNSCGSKSTAGIGSVGSISNARASGTLQARQGTTVLASAVAGATTTVGAANRLLITNVFC